MRHGWLQASFIPPAGQRDLHDLMRSRTKLVQKRGREVNRVQGVWERANSKLAAWIEGRADPATLANPSPPAEPVVAPAPPQLPLTCARAVSMLDTIPGIHQRGTELLVAAWGIDMTRFGTADVP
jgi:hypothetical protein